MAQENDLDEFLNEKFGELQPDEGGEDFSNPLSPANQINRVKADYARTHPGIDTKFKRLKAGKSWE